MTTSNALPMQSDESLVMAQTYQQAMQNLNAIVIARPAENVVMLKPGQLTTVAVQAGQHYKLRKVGNDGVTQQTPDNVVAVRHGDNLHLRYADGSTASFDNFFSVCTDSSVCSVNLASDSSTGVTLSGADASNGPIADDGLLVYAHGDHDVLMAMAQGQSNLESAVRGLGDAAVLTYVPPDNYPGILALALLGAAGAAGAASAGGASGAAALAATSTIAVALTPIETISQAAQNNTATSTSTTPGLTAQTYAAAGVSGVTSTNLGAINSALDSILVNGAAADTAAKVQAIVDAYGAIFKSADGVADNAPDGPTAAQYTAIGVTGVTGKVASNNALYLLDNAVDAKPMAGVDTVAEVQAIADAAKHVMSGAAGGAAPTLADFVALGVSGVDTSNLVAVQAAIAATDDSGIAVHKVTEIQALVNTVSTANALNAIRDAAENNTATPTTPGVAVYVAAGVTGVSNADLAAINSALDSPAVTGAQANTTPEVQAIVNAYNAILASADGVANNTSTPLTGAQYTLVGVTGLSGVSAPGNTLHLLDDVVDAIPTAGVDSVPELQVLADAAGHVISGAAGGTGPTLLELAALGISGVTATNLAAVQQAIAATPDDGTGVDTRGELQTVVNTAIAAGQVPHITSVLGGVSNLEVTSNLVLNADQSVTVGSGFIHITDLGGAGYQGDTSTNTQNIDVSTAIANHMLTITGTGANTHIVINPMWDLDLSSNYQLSFDSGVFLDAAGSHAAVAVAPINFSTVTPGTHAAGGTAATEAHASQTMVDATGALTAGKSWMSIEGIGNNTGGVTQLGDLSTGAYALVMKNYATTPGGASGDGTDGIAAHDTNVGVINFGNNDIVYFDSQVNNTAVQLFDARYTGMTDGGAVGGVAGQNALVIGLTNNPQQAGSNAMVLLGLEGNTTNQIYSGIVTLGPNSMGWADAWHATNPPVIMG